jgi:hypothetical protein
MDLRPQIFVAMSFAEQYKSRLTNIIEPAVRGIEVDSVPLQAYRVDLSKSGDSILTDIMDGIAHSQMVLADVSTVGKDAVTGQPYRNGNVMYEVGLALACRQPSEVLLIRDDHDKFLFDVSTVPHMTIDFTDTAKAIETLHEALVSRLRERDFVNDARVRLAIASLSGEEIAALKNVVDVSPGTPWGRPDRGQVDFFGMASIPRLLDKQLIQVVGAFEEGHPAYTLTPLGRVVAQFASEGLPRFNTDPEGTAAWQQKEGAATTGTAS